MSKRLFMVGLLLGTLFSPPCFADTEGAADGGTAAYRSSLVGGKYRASPLNLIDGQQAGMTFDSNGYLMVDSSGGGGISATVQGQGTAGVPVGGVLTVQGVASMTPFSDNITQVGGASLSLGQKTMSASIPVVIASDQSALSISLVAPTTGGWSTYSAPGGTGNALVSTTVVSIKSSAGTLHSFTFYNANASVAYCQIFNVASGSVTLGTTVPTESYPIPSQGWYDKVGFDAAFGTAISMACTTTATGNTALGTGIQVDVEYK